MSFIVEVIEGEYPSGNGTSTLVGVHPTYRAAEFIAEKTKKRFKLPVPPKITPSNLPVTTDTVEHYLQQIENQDKQD